MSLSAAEVQRIASLARLRLKAGEAEQMAREMSAVLDHLSDLKAAIADEATKGRRRSPAGSPGTLPGPAEQGAAPDPLAFSPERMAPAWRAGFFVVPRLPAVSGRAEETDGSG